jgi:hypothetical protein
MAGGKDSVLHCRLKFLPTTAYSSWFWTQIIGATGKIIF